MCRARAWLVAVSLAALATGGGLAFAQSTDEIHAAAQVHLSNPGARSLGMGGAFTALADDATAAHANPAGLTQLDRFDILLEGRNWGYSEEFLDGGTVSLSGSDLDLTGALSDEAEDSTNGVSFGSIFYAFDRWAIGGFRHELVNLENEIMSDGVALPTGFVNPLSARMDLDIESYGVSAAVKLYENAEKRRSMSLGGTLTFSQFELASRTERLDNLRGLEDPTNPASEDAPAAGLVDADTVCCQFENRGDVRFFETQLGDDDDISFNVGLLWRARNYSVGAVFRRGAEFRFVGNSYERLVNGQTGERAFPSRGPWDGVFKVPDVWGVGLVVRPGEHWILSAEWDYVEHSELLDENLDITGKDENVSGTGCAPGTVFPCQGLVGGARDFQLSNGSEFRVGFEYSTATKNKTYFFRGGAWSDPDHEIQYRGPLTDQRALFLPGDDEIHGSAGFGFRFAMFQLDVGLDLSERVKTASISGAFFIGGK